MNVPPRVDAVLGDEDVAAHVPLKGEDALFVTPSRTLRYTAEGLLSDESVEEYPHDAERVEISEGRRKSKIVLDYGLDGQNEIPVPTNKLNDALHPILAGVLNAADVTGPGETVKRTYQFSELTLVVTSHRVVKHVGSAVWDTEFEEVPFEDVTGIGVEEGNVASQLVLETTGRTQRIKAPNEEFRDVRETIEDALYAYHDVTSAAEFERVVGDDEADSGAGGVGSVSFDDTVAEPELDTEPPAESEPAAAPERQPEPEPESTAEPEPEPESAPESTADPISEGAPQSEVTRQDTDELAASGFEKATQKVEPSVDVDALRVELERVQEELDRQQDALDAQRERVDAIRSLLPDES